MDKIYSYNLFLLAGIMLMVFVSLLIIFSKKEK